MLKFVLISALVAGASAGYASSQYAGAGTSSGYNGGFQSQYAGHNGIAASAGSGAFVPGFAPFQPVPAFPSAFDFNSFYQGLQANFANAAATQAYATGGATAVASASQFSYPGYYQQRAPAPPYGQQHPQQQHQQYQQAVPYQQRGPQYAASANSYYYNNYDNGYSNYDNAYK